MVNEYSYYRRENSTCLHSSYPSFSSSLLDSIYRSIDRGEEEEMVVNYRDTTRKNTAVKEGGNVRGGVVFKRDEEMANFQRACMIEKWMEKKSGGAGRRKSTAANDLHAKRDGEENSSSGSWDSGYGFFSSEGESFNRPKPIRVGDLGPEKPMKMKSRALKLYGDLKKVKQPISPGGRLASFLNSIFAGAGNTKKPKSNSSPTLKSANASTCSSASSFSRSCLSKTPSSRGKPTGGEKRSVRFSPVSVIVDEDRQPRGHKSLHEEHDHKKQANPSPQIRNYHEKIMDCDHIQFPFTSRNSQIKNQVDLEEEDDDDAASYASSDLFELDHLSAIGMEELPLYETTHLGINRAIMQMD